MKFEFKINKKFDYNYYVTSQFYHTLFSKHVSFLNTSNQHYQYKSFFQIDLSEASQSTNKSWEDQSVSDLQSKEKCETCNVKLAIHVMIHVVYLTKSLYKLLHVTLEPSYLYM